MLAVKCRNVWVIASVRDDGGFIQGGTAYCSISMANAVLYLLMGKSGDQVTVSRCSDVNSGMANDVEVNEIVGLLK